MKKITKIMRNNRGMGTVEMILINGGIDRAGVDF